MNGNFAPPEIKIESNELNNLSTNIQTMTSSPPSTLSSGPIQPVPVRSTPTNTASSLDVLPDSSRATSHASAPGVYSMKSPPTSNPAPPSISPSITTAPARNPLASLSSAKRKRLPQDKVGQLEDRIALDARDADAWLALIREHQTKGKISDARNTYERFFTIFPDLVGPFSAPLVLIVRLLSGRIMQIWN
jgi:cleavage stimulation factor subunit 3